MDVQAQQLFLCKIWLELSRDFLQVQLISAMARTKNSATEENIRKCLKGELDTLDPAKFNTDTEDVVEHYCIFIKSLLRLIPRPNVSVLSNAAQKDFLKAEPDTCEKWAQSICNAIQHCRKKVKSIKSGSKLTPGVKCICDVLKKAMQMWKAALSQVRLQPCPAGYFQEGAGFFSFSFQGLEVQLFSKLK